MLVDNEIHGNGGLDIAGITTLRNTVNIREDGNNTLLVQGESAGHTAFRVHAKDSAANSQTKVFGSLEVDGDVDIDDDTQATSTSTGSLVTLGGVGIAKNLHVGGTIFGNVTGDLTGKC